MIKTYAQKKTEHVEYFLVANDDSETHVGTNGNLEHEVSKARCRVQCRRCLRSSRQGETYCGCDRMLQDLTDVVQKQAEQRISSRIIMYVPDIHDLALNTQWVGAMKVQKNRKKTQKKSRLPRFREEAQLRNDRGALPPGREVQHAHARTRIHAIRSGRI